MPKHSLSTIDKAIICDRVQEAETVEEKTQQRLSLAKRYKVSPETINAISAHIKIRLEQARKSVGQLLKKRQLRIGRAWEGFTAADDAELIQPTKYESTMHNCEKAAHGSDEAYTLLQQGNLRGAIDAFSQVNDVEALERIAGVYAHERPDLAALALHSAGRIDGVFELVAIQMRKEGRGARTMIKRIFETIRGAKKR